jgi:hypothetical protein
MKHFEQDSLDDLFAEKTDGDEGPVDDLDRRLAGIDLGELYIHLTTWRVTLEVCKSASRSADKIRAVLTPEERSRFTRAVQYPTSELAKLFESYQPEPGPRGRHESPGLGGQIH